MKNDEIAAIQTVETLSSVLSVVGCSVVLAKLFLTDRVWNLTNKQLCVLCSVDLVTAFFWGVGHAGQGNEGFCVFQGFMIQWGGLSNICWNSAMALHLYHWISLKKNEDKLHKKLRKTAITSIGGSLFLALMLLAGGVYGPAYMWCWIADEYEWARFVFFYMILLIAWFYNAYIIKSVSDSLKSRNSTREGGKSSLSSAEAGIQQKLRQYILVFVIAWFFGLLNRFVEVCVGEPVFGTSLLHAFFVPLQGFMNAACYGGIISDLKRLMRRIRKTVSRPPSVEDSPMRGTSFNAFKTPVRRGSSGLAYVAKKYSIFVSSYNLGEAPFSELSEGLAEWLVEGHDIYAIGVQECMCVEEFREAMHTHLGGPEKFIMHTCEIGSNNTRLGFHGFIALTVFVRTEDINSGAIKMTESSANDVASGTDLIVTTAANKGAVGLPFQIHDTSIGFVTAHLPSDSKGKSKLGRRNNAAQSMLRDVVLASEDVGCDMQLQHDHIIILGDLNYRMNTPPQGGVGEGQSALFGIAAASAAEKRAMGDDPNWFKRKYELFYGPRSERCLSDAERVEVLQAADQAAAHWDSVLKHDEMTEMMNLGEVFFGFKEVPPRFPPTYKRKIGPAGDCGDYTSVSDLVQGFSHTGEEPKEGDVDDSRHSTDSSVSEDYVNARSSGTTTAISGESREGAEDGSSHGDTEVCRRPSTSDPPIPSMSVPDTDTHRLSWSVGGLDKSGFPAINAEKVSPKKGPRRSSVFSLPLRRSSGHVDRDKEKDKSKLRPPSYTDRILVHSLVENQKLMPTAYGFCDSLRASDHRPVCMSMTLEVNANVDPPSAAEVDSGEITNPHIVLLSLKIKNLKATLTQESAVLNPMLGEASSSLGAGTKELIREANSENGDGDEEYTPSRGLTRSLSETTPKKAPISSMAAITEDEEDSSGSTTLQGASVSGNTVPKSQSRTSIISTPPAAISPSRRSKTDKRISVFGQQTAAPTVAEVIVIFPLPGKDPLLEYRKMYNFVQAFHVGSDTGILKILQHRNAKLKDELLKSKRSYPWKQATSQGIELDSCGDRSLGVDALLKLVDTDGTDMGQAVVSLSHLLQPDMLGTPYSVEVPLSSGGQYKGTLSGEFILRRLHEQISLG
mmetsp:Transcript_12130/g.18320  ORF Transcript_12130/g.18320 Transcript_12130/m.18320 type:complete len:1126 (+) Transcript_12130:138-3515(+)|eukprot:CAMPEP_0185029506 /NCGR_PEP_ID=MMETSP1103-20130426/15847_1 /TAXON_ID=36769 /ORGANISM="Paraphysomonas bandaiensis, Strain Caron Lab Isolate" /LENGTH=1125 /DNA_ID=CAMNT_0027564279 /DNA_START=80 /DNA_END=3457 /DNA_ORIENTATION=-